MNEFIEKARCSDHQDYNSSRPPTDGCGGCWEEYNLTHDLPEGNRVARSSLDKSVRLSRWIPMMYRVDLPDKGKLGDNISSVMESRKDVVPVCMGIDVSLDSSAVAMIGYDVVAKRWLIITSTEGFGLPQNASSDSRENRKLVIVKMIMSAYRSFTRRADRIPVFIEDHAYSRGNTNRATEIHELHGVIKSQLYLETGKPVEPVNISTARSEVFCHGSPRGKVKKKLAAALKVAGHRWAEDLTDDEVDAWAVAAVHVKSNYAFGIFNQKGA